MNAYRVPRLSTYAPRARNRAHALQLAAAADAQAAKFRKDLASANAQSAGITRSGWMQKQQAISALSAQAQRASSLAESYREQAEVFEKYERVLALVREKYPDFNDEELEMVARIEGKWAA